MYIYIAQHLIICRNTRQQGWSRGAHVPKLQDPLLSRYEYFQACPQVLMRRFVQSLPSSGLC